MRVSILRIYFCSFSVHFLRIYSYLFLYNVSIFVESGPENTILSIESHFLGVYAFGCARIYFWYLFLLGISIFRKSFPSFVSISSYCPGVSIFRFCAHLFGSIVFVLYFCDFLKKISQYCNRFNRIPEAYLFFDCAHVYFWYLLLIRHHRTVFLAHRLSKVRSSWSNVQRFQGAIELVSRAHSGRTLPPAFRR